MRVTPTLDRLDAELVTAVRSGDVRAFGDLYAEHVDAVRRVVYHLLGDADAAADAVQDTFASALQHLGDLREPDRFRPWLLSIARHAATDQLRARKRLTPLDESYDDVLASTGPGPESLAEMRELADRVQGCVARLCPRDAAAVTMVTQLGFTPSQMADALGVTQGAAKVIAHRARRRLRNALAWQLMERQPSLACAEFRALLAPDPLAASKHIEHCETCLHRAGSEVVLAAVGAERSDPSASPRPDRRAQSPASPSTLMPRSRTASARESGSTWGHHSTSSAAVAPLSS